jgi:hypothetical protein
MPLVKVVCSFPLLLLAACQPYTLVFNDNVVYSPIASIREGPLRDPGLQACLNQALEANGLQDPATVTLLACPGAGVENLAGIEVLTNLEQLELSDNSITNLSPLVNLKKLRVLNLRNNAVGDLRPLDTLPILRFVSLEGNEGIPCRQLDELGEKLGNTLSRPLNCIR